ncbi:hypothetical protein [Streptomyces sp. NPDC029003]|uniref:hypothetical protein n=1 Tax=Streptomyces sp. NPDC029003 TaxID=3155125 RepID=UPI0033D19199
MDPRTTVVRLCAQGMAAEAEGRGGDARTLFARAWDATSRTGWATNGCAPFPLPPGLFEPLALLLPPYLTDLGRPEDRERLTAALRMLHAERRLPDPDQAVLAGVIGARG